MDRVNRTPGSIVQEYSEYSTVAGLVYIFMQDQKIPGKIFWTFVVGFLFGAGVYGSIYAYNDWQDHPVVTTVTTTGYPIRKLPFPAVTICSQGYIEEILFATLFKAYNDFMVTTSGGSFQGLPYAPIQMGTYYEKKFSENLTKKDIARLEEIGKFLSSGWGPFSTAIMTGVSPDLVENMNIEVMIAMTGVLLSSNPEVGLRQNVIEAIKRDIRFQNVSVLELLLDPNYNAMIDQNTQLLTQMIKTIIKTIDMQVGFQSYFQTLWYATLPCFDIQNITAMENGTTAMLQLCKWKGQPVSCAAIFSTFPTDSGMCCEFNMVKANELFLTSQYTNFITLLQTRDKMNAFINGTDAEEFLNSPDPEQGAGNGLWVLLDSHSNLLAPRTVFSDFNQFDVLVGPRTSFPFVKKKSIQIKPGHYNAIALSATTIEAEDDIRGVDQELRICKFDDEVEGLKFHKIYSQANCLLECSMSEAQRKLQIETNASKICTPWYLPFEAKGQNMCDPWESARFEELMSQGDCSYCLPDCKRTIYHTRLSVSPFKKCDDRNFGMTKLCNVENAKYLTKPHIFGQQVLDEFQLGLKKNPDYLNVISSNIRTYESNHLPIFHYINQTYDAFDVDIAELEIFFEVETALKFETTKRMAWIDFLSNVGGLLGLCIGLSAVTIVELIWLGMRIVAVFLQPRYTHDKGGSKHCK